CYFLCVSNFVSGSVSVTLSLCHDPVSVALCRELCICDSVDSVSVTLYQQLWTCADCLVQSVCGTVPSHVRQRSSSLSGD
uniref:Uncharacterized protein n=1 Tax=Cynoglossus semilaevis TaxID=244447 RepID=A0A3P8WBP1_CYNSE